MNASDTRHLDFGPARMCWHITHTTADTGGAYFEAINVLLPDFGGPPVHAHPHATESYAVTDGVLDVCVNGQWRQLRAGEKVTVPAGVAHTLRNTSGAEVRLINRHAPALDFEGLFRRLHAMAAAGQVTLPPKGVGALARLAMLFVEHEREIVSVRPPQMLLRAIAWIGRLLRYQLPPR